MLECRELVKSYGSRVVLGPISTRIKAGEQVAIMGPSGAGKSTLLFALAGLEIPDAGACSFLGVDWRKRSEAERRRARLEGLGLLFQSPDLITELSLEDNVALPLEFLGHSAGQARSQARELLAELGLGQVLRQHPQQVSGGEAQRAALARALVTRPTAVLADEPTGSLDTAGRDAVLQILTSQTRDLGATLVVVTHDPVVADKLDRTISLLDGRVQGDVSAA